MNVAVIPARGGSKRITGKNIKAFRGKPIIAWSIEAARNSGLFDRVIVSTDDPEIAGVAKQWGAEVPFVRPAELSDDHTGTIPVMAHATRWCQEQGQGVGAVCCIYATAPLIQVSDLKTAFAKLEQGGWQYVFSATTFAYSVFRALKQDAGEHLAMLFPEHFLTRSQDLPEAMHDAGQFYWGRPQAWIEERRIFEHWSSTVLLPRWRVQDIDTPEDWAHAEALAEILTNPGNR